MRSGRSDRTGTRRAGWLAALLLCLAALVPSSATARESAGVDLYPLLIKYGDMPAFDPSSTPFVPYNLSGWIEQRGYEGEEGARIESRLSELKWMTGVELGLGPLMSGGKASGAEILGEFDGDARAKLEMKAELAEDVEPGSLRPGQTLRFFRVPGVPGAKGIEHVAGGRGVFAEVLFVYRPVLVRIEASVPKGASRKNAIAGAQAVLSRARG